MTAADAATLFILAILDGAFAGFRSSAGRTGLINHRRSDHQAARRGAVLAFVLLAPVIAATSADVLIHPVHLGDYTRAGTAMLAVYGPYGLLVLTALASALLIWHAKESSWGMLTARSTSRCCAAPTWGRLLPTRQRMAPCPPQRWSICATDYRKHGLGRERRAKAARRCFPSGLRLIRPPA